ncbi:unnamed protein product [Discosporangium mesarthrocarpum]
MAAVVLWCGTTICLPLSFFFLFFFSFLLARSINWSRWAVPCGVPAVTEGASSWVSQGVTPGIPARHFSSGGGDTIVPVPSMGDSITEGTIVEWAKSTGDAVQADEVVVVLETDKVSIDVRAPEAGTLVEQMAAEGDTVEVGVPLMKLNTRGGGASSTAGELWALLVGSGQ